MLHDITYIVRDTTDGNGAIEVSTSKTLAFARLDAQRAARRDAATALRAAIDDAFECGSDAPTLMTCEMAIWRDDELLETVSATVTRDEIAAL